jgi:hypothetical protein
MYAPTSYVKVPPANTLLTVIFVPVFALIVIIPTAFIPVVIDDAIV